jgi:Zn-dependent protease with chaperone function
MSWRARWFDGRRSTPHPVRVSVDGQQLRIHADEDDVSQGAVLSEVPAAALSVGDPFRNAPRMIGLPDGGTLQVEDGDGGFDSALRQAGHLPGGAFRLIERWRHALPCLVLLISVVVWLDRQGIGLIAGVAVQVVPQSVDARLGSSALELADAQWLTSSRLPADRRLALQTRFLRLVHDQYPALHCRLLFRGTRGGRWDNFNAFALPGGTIVLLDGLAEAMDDEEVLAVLGHELGHVVHRDGMHGLAQQMGLLAVATVVLGDISNLAPAVAEIQALHYSRDMEADADAFAVGFLRRSDVPVQRLADAFAVMQREEATRGSMPAYLSNHPATAERLRAARAATGQPIPQSAASQSSSSASQ